MTMHPVPSDATLTFAAGLPGFESCRRFVLLQSDEFAPGVCLKGLDGDAPAFLLVDPRLIAPGFRGQLSDADRVRLGGGDDAACVWLVMVSAAGPEPRVNLRAPIVINATTMRGIQLVPTDETAPVDVSWTEAACWS
jgi:flagellar assembly factor FliW